MFQSEFLETPFHELYESAKSAHALYTKAEPFPYICVDNFFKPKLLKQVLQEFPDMNKDNDIRYKNVNEDKFASRSESRFGEVTRRYVHFLNSQPFLAYLTCLTGIEGLLPDPYFWGGGFHQIKRGGFLKIHADFNRHPYLNLDRRLNLLVYLNEDWDESYGGHFELWDNKMTGCRVKLLPLFNRLVIFNTTDDSYHGHPDPLTCPEDRSRKSLALYYYTNGRPANEVGIPRLATDFRGREGMDSRHMKQYNKMIQLVSALTPPILFKYYKKYMNK
ncbi:2OG-Fe(II) oxygenase [Taibaiella helva]|uniref:2OG-Fe(II) oxygenase n=1 Tax=Taibaiella helva TaxID=2301235 RepID=UPI000E591BBC|nr:2OG-Fe(II) oxygenase [Taibaiella helva]